MGKYNFDEIIDRSGTESLKYDAGRVYSTNFLVSMYAMMVCGEKLKEKEKNKND